jgi:hypothetical protein
MKKHPRFIQSELCYNEMGQTNTAASGAAVSAKLCSQEGEDYIHTYILAEP